MYNKLKDFVTNKEGQINLNGKTRKESLIKEGLYDWIIENTPPEIPTIGKRIEFLLKRERMTILEEIKSLILKENGYSLKGNYQKEVVLRNYGWYSYIMENTPPEMKTVADKINYLIFGENVGKCIDCGRKTGKNSTKKGGFNKRCKTCATIERNSVDVDRDEIRRLYVEEKYSTNEIAKMDVAIDKKSGRHISNVCVKNIVGKENMRDAKERQQNYYSKNLHETNKLNLDLDKIRELYVDKERTTGYIARLFNCNEQTVRNQLKRMGIELREINISTQEIFIREFLDSLGVDYETSNRSILDKWRELDIYIPSKNLAIEINGIYWHSDEVKSPRYHQDKTLECKEKGIQLIHFTDSQIDNKPLIVKSMLKSKLGFLEEKLNARELAIKEVSKSEEKQFLNMNHIQGYIPSEICYGLYKENELYSLISFSQSRFDKSYVWEILRACSKTNTHVNGAFSKLIKHFRKQHNGSIISYCNMDYSLGNSYLLSGFSFKRITEPSYFYINRHGEMKSRYSSTKKKLVKRYPDKQHLSEREIMKELGFYKIYNSGNMVFILE